MFTHEFGGGRNLRFEAATDGSQARVRPRTGHVHTACGGMTSPTAGQIVSHSCWRLRQTVWLFWQAAVLDPGSKKTMFPLPTPSEPKVRCWTCSSTSVAMKSMCPILIPTILPIFQSSSIYTHTFHLEESGSSETRAFLRNLQRPIIGPQLGPCGHRRKTW